MQIGVELRNRCESAVSFVVGPEGEAPPEDAPVNELDARDAVFSWVPYGHHLHVRASDGGYAKSVRVATGDIIFSGAEACVAQAVD